MKTMEPMVDFWELLPLSTQQELLDFISATTVVGNPHPASASLSVRPQATNLVPPKSSR